MEPIFDIALFFIRIPRHLRYSLSIAISSSLSMLSPSLLFGLLMHSTNQHLVHLLDPLLLLIDVPVNHANLLLYQGILLPCVLIKLMRHHVIRHTVLSNLHAALWAAYKITAVLIAVLILLKLSAEFNSLSLIITFGAIRILKWIIATIILIQFLLRTIVISLHIYKVAGTQQVAKLSLLILLVWAPLAFELLVNLKQFVNQRLLQRAAWKITLHKPKFALKLLMNIKKINGYRFMRASLRYIRTLN